MAFRACGNLACLHIRNFRCAIAVCVKLRGLRAFGGTSRAFVGGFMSFGGRVGCSVVGGVWGTRWLYQCGETLFLRFVYIFCSVGGVLSAREHRAVGGSSDGGVKGNPLNNPRFG